MTRTKNAYTGDLTQYGYGPEFNWFSGDASQVTAPSPAPTPAPAAPSGPAATPNPGPVGVGVPSPVRNPSFTGNIGGAPNPSGAMPDPASRADTSGMNFGTSPQPGVDYSGSLEPSEGSTTGSTIGKYAGGLAGSMIGGMAGPLGSIAGSMLGRYAGSKLGGLADTPGAYGNSAISQNGPGGFGQASPFGSAGHFGRAGALFGDNQAPGVDAGPGGGGTGPEGGIGGGGGIAAGVGGDSLTGPGGMGGNFGGGNTGGNTGGGSGGNLGGSYGGSDPTGGGGLGSPSSTGSLGSVGGDSAGGFGGGMGGFGSGGGGGGSSSGGSSRVICTELYRQGLIPADVWISDLVFTKRHISRTTVRGYQWWGVPAVKLMRRSPGFSRFMLVALARPRAQELAWRMGHRECPDWHGKLVRLVMEPLCWLIGTVVEQVDYATELYAPSPGPASGTCRQPGPRSPEGVVAAGNQDPGSSPDGQPRCRRDPAEGVP